MNNHSNERIMAILASLRRLPRWALILITLGVFIVLGFAMFLLLPEAHPQQAESALDNATNLAFSVFLKLGVVVILLIGLAIILRRWQTKAQTNQNKQIEIIETVHLSPHRTLYLIKIDDKKILLGATDQTVTNLSTITLPPNFEQEAHEENFSKILSSFSSSDKSK